ncbi:transposase, partial [Stenomitos frigidus]
ALAPRLDALKPQMQALAHQQADWQRPAQLLPAVQGRGQVTATLCLVAPPTLGKRSATQRARLVGVAPRHRDSGQHKGKRLLSGGRTRVRCGLSMATRVATPHNPVRRDLEQPLLAKRQAQPSGSGCL